MTRVIVETFFVLLVLGLAAHAARRAVSHRRGIVNGTGVGFFGLTCIIAAGAWLDYSRQPGQENLWSFFFPITLALLNGLIVLAALALASHTARLPAGRRRGIGNGIAVGFIAMTFGMVLTGVLEFYFPFWQLDFWLASKLRNLAPGLFT
jgi:hypothetical protein